MQTDYDKRPSVFRGATLSQWEDWRWQQQNATRTLPALLHIYPNLSVTQRMLADTWAARNLRFSITPYMHTLFGFGRDGSPLPSDPIWRQFFPLPLPESGTQGADEYAPTEENWEEDAEMVTPIMHHKYPNRAIIYVADACLAYCGYCLRSLNSTDERERHGGLPHWEQTLKAIADRPKIEEVILSGGDPLVLNNERLEALLQDLRDIPSVCAIRIHSRSFTHNPYRLDAGLGELLRKYTVTEMAVHALHPNELTFTLELQLERLRALSPTTMFLGQSVLIKGVNDDVSVLRSLFFQMYLMGIKPYYLNHPMPNIPAAAEQRTSVRRGVELMRALKRYVSNAAMPEYIIVHKSGKHTVPLEPEGTPEFQYSTEDGKHPSIRFKNWKNEWVDYLDGRD